MLIYFIKKQINLNYFWGHCFEVGLGF